MAQLLSFKALVRALPGAALALTLSAHAELGGMMPTTPSTSGAVQHMLLNGAVRERSSVDAGGTVINEYATSDGRIFAYTWTGPTMPDLQALLGKHTDSFRSGALANRVTSGELHASRVEQPDVVVESGGQMRSYIGRAWLPNGLPPGVSADDLK
ncbi:DUF2844 domain-containing protein [Paraburkholderia bonniea]|uniref:DUF2844 domain-containing protein n=1 Tax=Paraburkholderia bonniea TaxID=2152891 RepID=UPI001290AA10|nr:DUF2844 domain-containing protein [Paraburkholderia bonniea]WJF91082.1 DUF2844 domain-containing protein [Paraburkholderia bonniea]WJF94397.1 DUF2844 domain-containing protein [Paraburkholderia bonniea]